MDIGKQPVAFYLAALIVGILLYPIMKLSFITLITISTMIGIVLITILFKIRYRTTFSVLLLIGWGVLGLIVTHLNTNIPPKHYTHFIEEENKVSQYLVVTVKEQINSNEKNRKYIAEVTSITFKNKLIRSSGKILLYLDKNKFSSIFLLGNKYVVKVRTQSIFSPKNPHQFDYKKYLKRNYILKTGYVEEVLSEEVHTSLWYTIKNSNQRLSQRIDASILQPESKEFLKAFLLGDRAEMNQNNIEAYSSAGIMHLIAISGMHVVIIFGFVFSLLTLFVGNKNKRWIIIVSLLFVWVFGCFVGLTSSVLRACMMLTIYYVFELLKRHSNIYHSLSLSAVFILLYNPYELFSIGFQLSYIAVFFIAWLSPEISKIFKVKIIKENNYIVKPLAATLAAQLGVIPLVVYYFHQFSLLSIIANIFLIPYSFIITYASLIELGVVLLPIQMQGYISFLYDFSVKLLINASRWVTSVEPFMFKNIPLNTIELILVVLAIVLLKYFLAKMQLKKIFPVLICSIIFLIFRLVFDVSASEQQNMIIFQNNYPLVGLREGKEVVFFTDRQDDIDKLKKYIINPYLAGERINKVEYKQIDSYKVYRWRNKTIQFINAENKNLVDTVDYAIVKGSVGINKTKEKIKKVVLINRVSLTYIKHLRSNIPEYKIWETQKQGAFIESDF